MQVLNGVWSWLRGQVASATGHNPRRRRQNFARPHSRFAAQVEALETRELLSFTYHGGALIANVANQNIFLGSDWTTNHGLNVQAGQLESFTSSLVSSKFMDGLTLAGYNVFRGTSTKGAFDNITLNKSFDGVTGGITDAQVQGFIQSMINAKTVQQPNANTLYTIIIEPGVLIDDNGSTSANAFLGYHSGFSGTTATGGSVTIHYSIIPYPLFPNFNYAQNGFASSLNQMTAVISHETAEAVTDPNVQIAIDTGDSTALGWNDDATGAEIADLSTSFLTMFQGHEVENIEAPDFSLISPNGTMPGLTAPTNLALTSLPTPGTATLSWSGVALGQGYRVFSISGTTRTLLGSTDAHTFSLKLTGLTSGASKTFIVEAFDGQSVADSKPATLIVPPPGAAAPLKGATPLTIDPHGATPAMLRQWFFDGIDDRRRHHG
jgi:hypothetical protein